jgi:hypothetical protein
VHLISVMSVLSLASEQQRAMRRGSNRSIAASGLFQAAWPNRGCCPRRPHSRNFPELPRAAARLRMDLESGRWDEPHGQLRKLPKFDTGYCLIMSDRMHRLTNLPGVRRNARACGVR